METMTASASFRHNQRVSPIVFVLSPTRIPNIKFLTATVKKHFAFKMFD